MGDPAAQPLITGLRLARWAILVGAILLAAVLAITGWGNYAALRDSARQLEEGEAMSMAQDLLSTMRRTRRPPTQADVDDWLDNNRDRGARFAAFLDGRALSAGEPMAPAPPPAGEPEQLTRIGGRIRLALTPPRPPPDGRPPPRPRPPPGDRPPPGPRPPDFGGRPPGPRPAPGVVIELEPVRLVALMDRARRNLGINLGVGGALLIIGLLGFRTLRGREQRELARARDKQLARLGEMSAVLAHEIRNPLASLKGHAQLLGESLPDESAQRGKVDRIVDEAVRLERLTGELLELVRTGEIDRRPCSPSAIATGAADEVGHDRIRTTTDAAPASWSLDSLRMHQVLTNLLRNAVEASPDGEAVDLIVDRDGDRLRFLVRDRGAGIPPGHEEQIFEAFHTTRTRGTGLGLAVSRRLVELHGGTLQARNHPDGGAIMTATIPAAKEA